MARFLAGMVVGLVLGIAGSAYTARMVGQDGPLLGWTVTHDGEEVCSDPDIDMSAQEIQRD